MSQAQINRYLAELDRLRMIGGTHRESVVREAFKDLLKGWGRQHDLTFIPEYKIETPARETRFVDGALLHELRVPFGYWEAKDAKDDLDEEIAFKFKRGYPQDNIIFEDSTQAILIQHGKQVTRCDVTDVQALERLLKLFFAYERPEIADFRKAVQQFKTDLPAVLKGLRDVIADQHSANDEFRTAASEFLLHAQKAINPSLGDADVREMLIQHILTEEIFSKIFDDSDYHHQNNVARELYRLEATFFKGGLKKRSLKALEPYYAAIRAAAAQIGNHSEKQAFLKVIYENFYKVYNPKAADRLGVVYTPNELVRFMIDGADWLCEQHFHRNLIDKDVEILDPATGTGTFICELLEHFRGQPLKLKRKYDEELHANEVAILPYYVANLNIEATYAAITGKYEEFANLCFVDTLDNVGLHTAARGTTGELFGSVSEVNMARIKRQNTRRISVIIGNPPYNANQANENDKNKNRKYPVIDQRIKRTYIADSHAQKTKLYDMYARFFRWASDRLDENGILAFVTNRSFVSSRTFDGFRRTVANEFAEIRIVDLGGDVRGNPRLSGTKHNVFGIQTGVAISFLVKRKDASGKKGARIFYARRPELETAEEKLGWLGSVRMADTAFDELHPDTKANWLDVASNDFDALIPVAATATKQSTTTRKQAAIFKLFSLGVVSNRDEWVYDEDPRLLMAKVKYFVDTYEAERARWSKTPGPKDVTEFVSRRIKWTSELESHLVRGTRLERQSDRVREAMYRPFCKRWTYYDAVITHRVYKQDSIFPIDGVWRNKSIVYTQPGSQKAFMACAIDALPDLHFVGAAAGAECLPLYRLDSQGVRHDNITDWALKQFREHYRPASGEKASLVTKEGIFYYVYAVLHDPEYREMYEVNLKREFPRIPLFGASVADFKRWAECGRQLMNLHIGYEQVAPWPLERTDSADNSGGVPKCLLKWESPTPGRHGRILIDSETTLDGVPSEAKQYMLGNRAALDWVMNQYKEKKLKDPTVSKEFDTYRFADYKEKVVDLLARLVRVSMETVAIVESLQRLPR